MSLTPVTREQLAGLHAKRLAEIHKRNIETVCSKVYWAVLGYADNSSSVKAYTVRVIYHRYIDKIYGEETDSFYMILSHQSQPQQTMSFHIDSIQEILERLRELFVDCRIEYIAPSHVSEGSITIDWS